jgi:hypothetical protein
VDSWDVHKIARGRWASSSSIYFNTASVILFISYHKIVVDVVQMPQQERLQQQQLKEDVQEVASILVRLNDSDTVVEDVPDLVCDVSFIHNKSRT